MLQSNRVYLDLGIPELDPRAFKREGGQIKTYIGGGGGGGSSQPTSQTITQTTIPEYARPYAEEMLGETQSLTDISRNPFQFYDAQRFAGFSPMQAQAFQNISGQQVAPQIADASNLAYTGASQGLGAQQTAQGLQQTALGYGQAGAGYGGAASTLGMTGAQQAMMDAQRAQQFAQMYGGMGAQAGQQGFSAAQQAQRAAEGQADIYGQMGAGFGAQAAGLSPQAQQYGQSAADIGMAGLGFGTMGAGIGGRGVSAAEQGFGAGQQYAQQATSPESMQAYMSPYMQNVVDQQQREAARQSEIQRQGIQSQAAQQGAFGGSRSAIVEAERQRNLATQLGDIQGAGLQRAFEQAQQAQQFGAGLGIQGLQAGFQGLQTGMQGTAQGMQGAQTGIAGQQAGLAGLGQAGSLYGLGMTGAGLGLQGTGQRLAAGQLGLQGAQTGIQGAQAGLQGVGQQLAGGQLGLSGAQTGIQGQQVGMQGAQTGLQGVGQATGAGQYGLAGSQLGIQGAGALGQLGQTQYGQEMGITDAMQKYGALQQQQQQQALDFQYQQFLAQQQYPFQMQAFRSDMLRGVPSSQSAQFQSQAQPSMAPQLLGAGLAAYGAFGRKEGGQVGGYREGGQVEKYQGGGNVSPVAMQTMAVQEMPSKLRRLSDSQLAAYARSVKDAITLSAIQSELQRRERARMPGGEPPEVTTAESIAKRAEQAAIGQPMVGMAGGGIVALAPGGLPQDAMMDPSMGSATSPFMNLENINPPPPPPPASTTPFQRYLQAIGMSPKPESPLPSAPETKPSITEALASVDDAAAQPSAGLGQGQQSGQTDPQASRQTAPRATRSGIAQLPTTFDQFREMSRQVEPNEQDQAVLADMQRRVQERMGRAEKQGDVAKYDAIMMAGLAMMGGMSLADGIAKAAQTGGATYLAGKQEANKALDAAENAELAFNKYQIELRRGDEKAAGDLFNNYTKHVTKLMEIDAANARTAALGGDAQSNRLMTQARQIEAQIDRSRQSVANQPKFKAELDALTAQEKQYGTLPPASQARRNTILSEIETEVAERTRNLEGQLANIYGKITGDTGGFKVTGQKSPQ